jgi:sigma-70-like protein
MPTQILPIQSLPTPTLPTEGAATTLLDPADLLLRAAAGHADAWAAIVARYTPVLRGRVRRYRLQDADAHDVIQVTWLRLAQHLDRIHTPEHLAGWLAAVANRECLRVLRDTARIVVVPDVGPVDADPGPSRWSSTRWNAPSCGPPSPPPSRRSHRGGGSCWRPCSPTTAARTRGSPTTSASRSGASVPPAPGRSPTCAGWWSAGPSAAQTRLSSGWGGRKRATADDGPDEDGGSR